MVRADVALLQQHLFLVILLLFRFFLSFCDCSRTYVHVEYNHKYGTFQHHTIASTGVGDHLTLYFACMPGNNSWLYLTAATELPEDVSAGRGQALKHRALCVAFMNRKQLQFLMTKRLEGHRGVSSLSNHILPQ